VSRTVGLLLVVQMVLLILPFALLHPIASGPQSFLANAAPASGQITTAVFLFFVNSAVTIGLALALFPVVAERSRRMALALFAASVVWFVMQSIDNAHILSLLSLSRQFVEGGAANADLQQAVGAAAYATRRWIHYNELLVIDCWMFLLYATMYRFAFVPRMLAAFGLLTVALHFIGIPLLGFLGYPIITPLGVAMAVSQLALAAWLLVKGFANNEAVEDRNLFDNFAAERPA
jgi:hypothetical protein